MFKNLNLRTELIKSLENKGFEKPTPIQEKIISFFFQSDNDIIGVSDTGTGKTAAFSIPILNQISISKSPSTLILVPTRELALQIVKEINSIKDNRDIFVTAIYGGSSISLQINQLRKGSSIVVGTPGRVIDLINRNKLDLSALQYLVLDEADTMLDMGFISDLETIISSTNNDKRILLFSATMPEKIKKLSNKYMRDQKILEVESSIGKSLIRQVVLKVEKKEKLTLIQKIIAEEKDFYGIIFCQSKIEVESAYHFLSSHKLDVDYLHGDILQSRRERILRKFRGKKISILVATDVASRGLDIPNISHVINYSLGREINSYIHRIGRTGRAGKTGVAYTLISKDQYSILKSIIEAHKIEPEIKSFDFKKSNFVSDSIDLSQVSSKKSFGGRGRKPYNKNSGGFSRSDRGPRIRGGKKFSDNKTTGRTDRSRVTTGSSRTRTDSGSSSRSRADTDSFSRTKSTTGFSRARSGSGSSSRVKSTTGFARKRVERKSK